MRKSIPKKPVKSKADTGESVFFHCPLVVQTSALDCWAIEQIAFLSSAGWRLSRHRQTGIYHMLSPGMGEA